MTQRIINWALLTGFITTVGLEWQLHSLGQRLAQIESNQNRIESSAAAAVRKFENDLFLQLQVERAHAAQLQAAQAAANRADLRALPADNFRSGPQVWERN